MQEHFLKYPPEGDSDEFVTVAAFLQDIDLQLARSFLEFHGIETAVIGEHIGHIAPSHAFFGGGMKHQVRRRDEELARELLSSAKDDAP